MYAMASWFGVSYSSILGHLRWALRKLSQSRYDELKRVAPRIIRSRLLSGRESQHLVVMTSMTPRIPIDLEAGDFALLPPGVTADGSSVTVIEKRQEHTLLQAVNPGISLVRSDDTSWAAAVRVMRRGYTGRSVFRNLESEDDE
jgi:hypothetical protein